MSFRKAIGCLLISFIVFGCTKTTNPVSSSSSGNVTMSVAFSNTGTPVGFKKASATTAGVDSIRIDSAIVVFARIRFESDIDTVTVDTSTSIPFINVDEDNSSVTFRGPFAVHVGDTAAISFASDTLPAGTYTGIKFDIHRLAPAERFWDSDDFNHKPGSTDDSSTTNYSIVVWGAVHKDTAWVPFEFKDNQNLEFKVRGTFTITNPTTMVNVALNFNMGSWFVNPFNGAILDPTDMSLRTYLMIQQAIRASFNNGRCGDWDDHWRWAF
ncbi:MAG TPA: hypothetical protein VLX91_06305 [Candidatus Acidoferrales bacterium]|nr:hypothetical protein [Candidatus Acidoferrales bacterium]